MDATARDAFVLWMQKLEIRLSCGYLADQYGILGIKPKLEMILDRSVLPPRRSHRQYILSGKRLCLTKYIDELVSNIAYSSPNSIFVP